MGSYPFEFEFFKGKPEVFLKETNSNYAEDKVQQLICRLCGAENLEVYTGTYITYARCPKCKCTEEIHSG